MTAGDTLTARLAPVTLVVGKGGVGKTTVAAALATDFARSGQRTLVVTTDPAATLLSAFGRPIDLTTAPTPIAVSATARPVALSTPTRPVALSATKGSGPSLPSRLSLWAIDTHRVRDEFLERWREPIALILDRGTYLDLDDVRGLVDATLPGADEIFALLALGDVLRRTGDDSYERIVIDTAPTGHTLRLLDLPRSFDAVVRLLDAMQEKHRFMVRALTHRYRTDTADALIADLRERVDALQKTLSDPRTTQALLVTRPEPVVIAESVRYLEALNTAGISIAAILINTWGGSEPERAAIAPLDKASLAIFTVPPLESNVIDTLLDSVQALSPATKQKTKTKDSLRLPWTPAPSARSAATGNQAKANGNQPYRAKPITIVAGKGGVGKTTVSCAIAISTADAGQQTLLVSTDPAPSVGDALGQTIGDADSPVTGAPNLHARQMDAAGAFASLRDQYQDRIDEVFANIAGRGMDLVHDRQILRDLLSLAPPGIDELYALTALGNLLEEGRYTRIVVDPAPTGHLLRLLDMPALAIAWAHQLMRLMLKYKDVVGLGEAARDLLTFAQRTRVLEQRLHDPDQSAAVLVSLDEPLVRGESERLLAALRDRGVPVGAVVWNRANHTTRPLPTAAAVPQYFAPLSAPAPVGVDAIRTWIRNWTSS